MYQVIEARDAIQHVIRQVKKREIYLGFELIQGEKGVVGAIIKTQRYKYMLKFQKSLFELFEYSENGEIIKSKGVSFRSDQLYQCYDDNIFPMVCLKDGRIYFTTASYWLDWSIEHHKPGFKVINRKEDRKEKADNYTYYNIDIDKLNAY